MANSSAYTLGKILCDALGLDASKVTSLELHIASASGPAVLTIGMFAELTEPGGQLEQRLKRFHLVEIEEPTDG